MASLKIAIEVSSLGTLRCIAPCRGMEIPLNSNRATLALKPGHYVAQISTNDLSLDTATIGSCVTKAQALSAVGGDPWAGSEDPASMEEGLKS